MDIVNPCPTFHSLPLALNFSLKEVEKDHKQQKYGILFLLPVTLICIKDKNGIWISKDAILPTLDVLY